MLQFVNFLLYIAGLLLYLLCAAAAIFFPPNKRTYAPTLKQRWTDTWEDRSKARDDHALLHAAFLLIFVAAFLCWNRNTDLHFDLLLMGFLPIALHGLFFRIPSEIVGHKWEVAAAALEVGIYLLEAWAYFGVAH